MISARAAHIQSKLNAHKLFEVENKEILDTLDGMIKDAAERGSVEINNVLLSHKKKYGIAVYLESQGYKVREQKEGNLFTINWGEAKS